MIEPMQLPRPLATALEPLFAALPLSRAMPQLVVTRGGGTSIVGAVVRAPAIARNPALVAGLWLYVDELERSHAVSQEIDDATGSFWHGIMHRREGDFSNSHYWFRRAGNHPAMALMDDYDAHRFIDEVDAACGRGESPAPLVERQQREWMTLFHWCCGNTR